MLHSDFVACRPISFLRQRLPQRASGLLAAPPVPRARGSHGSARQGASREHVVFVNNNRLYLLSTYLGVAVAIPVVIYNLFSVFTGRNAVNNSDDDDVGSLSTSFAVFSFVIVSGAFAATRFLLGRTLLRIHYSELSRQFVGVRYNWRLASCRVVFAPGEAKLIPDRAKTWREFAGNFSIGGRSYYLPLGDFKSTYHYNLMLGYVDE